MAAATWRLSNTGNAHAWSEAIFLIVQQNSFVTAVELNQSF
jgi:hypothetical protein